MLGLWNALKRELVVIEEPFYVKAKDEKLDELIREKTALVNELQLELEQKVAEYQKDRTNKSAEESMRVSIQQLNYAQTWLRTFLSEKRRRRGESFTIE